MSQDKPGADVKRRIHPLSAPASAPESAPTGSSVVPDAAAAFAERSHVDFGNRLVADALGGAGQDGLGGTILSEMALASSGVAGQSAQFGSNGILRRVLRDAMHLDAGGKRALDNINRSSGRPLPQNQLERMNAAFDHDFSHVRIHTGGAAAQASAALNAHAFTLGADVFFGAGEWAPGTRKGDRLIAHELTHVLQHDEGRLGGSTQSDGDVEVSNPNEAVELEAYGNEDRILAALERVDRALEVQRTQDAAPLVEVVETVEDGAAVQTVVEVDAPVAAEDTPEFGVESLVEPVAVDLAEQSPSVEGSTEEAPAEAAGDMLAMADRAHAGPTDGAAIERIKNSRGQALPGAVAQRLGALLGHDFSHVRIHTDAEAAKAADALNAHAFALGADVFFGSGEFAPHTAEGQELLAHELTHVKQHDEGRIPTAEGEGMQVSSPSDAAEVEAREAASSAMDEAAAVGGFEMVEASPEVADASSSTASSPVDAPAMRQAQGQGRGESGNQQEDPSKSGGQGAGSDRLEVNFAGYTVTLQLPKVPGAGETLDWQPNEIDIPGLAGPPRFSVAFGQDGKPTRGDITCSFEFGAFTLSDITLSMNSDCEVAGSGQAELVIPEIGTATADIHISSDGVTVDGTITAENIAIPGVDWLTFTEGSAEFSGNVDGIEAHGTIKGNVEALGDFELGLSFVEGVVSGDFTLTVQEDGVPITEQATVESGTLTGTFSPEGFDLTVNAHINVQDFCTADVEDMTYSMPDGILSGTIVAQQWPESFSLGETVQVSNTTVTVVVEENDLTSITGTADYTMGEQWEGDVDLTYDAPNTALSGSGSIRMTEDAKEAGINLGEEVGGTVLKEAEATLNIEENKFIDATGNFRAEVPYEEQPTFEVSSADLNYTFEDSALTGTINARTMREITLGPAEGTQIIVEEDASATGSIQANKVQRLDGGIPFRIQDAIGPIGEGGLDFEMPEGSSDLNATATFTLSAPYGFPDRSSTTAYFNEGGTITVTMTEGSLDTATIEGLDFTVKNPDEEMGGQVDGTLGGSLAFETGMVNGSGSAALVSDWPIPVGFGELVLTEGGSIDIGLEESQITSFNGEIPFRGLVNSTKTEGPIAFEGKINGDLDRESSTITGGATADLTAPVVIPLENGDQIKLTGGGVTAAFSGADGLTEVGFNVAAEYYRQGELFLTGSVTDGKYLLADESLGFNAKMSLISSFEKANAEGTFTFRALAGSEVEVEVKNSKLERVGGGLNFEVDDTEGKLLAGSVSEVDLNLADEPKVSGNLDVRTTREFKHPRTGEQDQDTASAYQFVVETESGVAGSIKENEVQEVSADLNFRVDLHGGEIARGGLNGKWNLAADEFSGGGEVALTNDLPMITVQTGGEQGATPPEPSGEGAGRFESYTAFLAKGSNVQLKMTANELERASVDMAGFLNRGAERVADAQLNGQYKLGDEEQGFSGTTKGTVIQRIDWAEGERFDSFIDPGTGFEASMEASSITSASGTFLYSLDEEGQNKVVLSLKADYVAGEGITAEGEVQVTNDILISTPGDGWELFLAQGSGGKGKIVNDQLEHIGGTITLMMRLNGEDTIRGDFTADYTASQGTDAKVTGVGTVSVLAPIEMPVGDSEYRFTLLPSSGVTCSVKESALEYIDGKVTVAIADGAGDFLEADIQGKYTHGETDFTGKGSLTVTDERELANSGAYHLMLEVGGGAEIEVANMDLVALSATIPMRIDNPDPLVGIALKGTYVKDGERFDGTGEAVLLRQEAVAKDVAVGDQTYSFYLEEGTRAGATVEDNLLKEVKGTLLATVWDSTEFLRANAQGTYTRTEGDSTVSVNGSVEVTREKLLVEGDTYNVSLVPGSGATVVVEENQLQSLGGTITTRVDRVGGDGPQGKFATVSLKGTWTRDEGFNGRGSAVLESEFVAGVVGNYTLVVEPGAGAEVELANSDVTRIGGTIPVRLDEGQLQFIRGNLTGDYVVATKAFSGKGSAEVITAKQLATLGQSEQLWLNPGSGASVTVTDNELTEISGNVNLSLRDGSEYLVVQFGGRFDAAGGTGFTGGGKAEVTREKQLAKIGDYTFFLEPGAGAEADVNQNRLTRVGGNVPFRVNDGEGPLLRGQAEGEYLAETGMFSGKGDVRLARDLNFNAPGGVTLAFLEGSGGGGEVVNNELRRLSGTLKVEIGNADGPLIKLEAEGTFDAVNKNIESLRGSMEMLRPFELLDGNIIIDQVSGSAFVENNALKEASGSGRITLPNLNNMVGTFNVNYSTEGGTEQYWGDGKINFTLFDEPDKGRSMSGEIAATYNRDGSFSVSGEADYQMNEMIGGKVGVEMDQTFDPNINATLNVNTQLVPGKDLFRQEMNLIPRTEVPVYPGVSLFFGAKAGMGLEMLPLMMEASIGVSNWRPLAAEANVPDFDAELALSWGLNFDALIAAYMSMGLSIGVASASAGIRGEVALDVPLTISPHGALHGGSEGYWGELGIDLNISPSLALRVIPFVDAAITGMDPFVHDFPGLEMNLENIADFNWGTTYIFGDREESQSSGGGAAPVETGSGQQNTGTTHEEEPQMGGNSDGGKAQAPGGPAVGSSDVEKSEDGGSQDGAMGELMATIDKIKIMAEGLGALGELVGLVVSLVTAFLTFGPVGLIVMAVWKVFTGELNWDNIVEKINKVVEAFKTAAELLRPYLPDWLQPIMDAFSGEKPGLLDALFGADDRMRESVAKGEHRYANVEFRATMIDTMMDGWCGGADERAITEILEFSDTKGEFGSVVRLCNGGADRIMDKLGGDSDRRVGALMRKNGIAYSTGW